MSTRYGDSQTQSKKNAHLQSLRRLLMVFLAFTFVSLSVFVFKVGRSRSPQLVADGNLPSAGLLRNETFGVSAAVNTESDDSETVRMKIAADAVQPLSGENEDDGQPPAETVEPPVPGEGAATDSALLPTQEELNAYAKDAPITYYAQSGDSLGVLAVRFGIDASEIRSTTEYLPDQLIPEGQVLFIPNRLTETTPAQKVFPDSEIVHSPSAIGFDVESYVNQAGGFLSTYSELVYGYHTLSGSQIIELVAKEYSIHPRLLLALIEHCSGWVFGSPQTPNDKAFPLCIMNMEQPGLYHQLIQAAGILGTGYYGWREGHTVILTFKNGETMRLAAELNAGSVALMHFFATQNTIADWYNQLYGENRFAHTYERMFDDPWRIASQVEPLIEADVVQPELILPFAEGVQWVLTSGPHAAWGAVDVRAALDFSPPKAAPGCERSYALITSVANGYVVRSENGAVAVDLDGDGNEQTGWVIVYLHVATEGRVEVGRWLSAGEKIGYPSCEGGRSTGSHLHIARKYNGEWVPADGPMPFVMSGWRAVMDPISLGGWLVKGEEIVKANLYGPPTSHISR